MGTSLNSQLTKDDNEYVYAVFRLGKIVVQRMFSPFYFTDHNFWMSSMGREHSKLLNILHGFTSKVRKKISKKISKLKKENFGLCNMFYSCVAQVNVTGEEKELPM